MLRAEAFALFIAVCNSPTTSLEMIEILRESMPGVVIETVTFDAGVKNPLSSVLAKVDPDGRGPIMLLGLEAANPSTSQFHPLLQILNLQRSEWATSLPRPVVIWLPEYLLRFLGTESPDFLDWRSDTFHFSDPREAELQALDASLWRQGLDGRLPQEERNARIAELRSRLSLLTNTLDPSVLAIKAGWLSELGNHYILLGRFEEAEQVYRSALEIGEKLEDQERIAVNLHQIGNVLFAKGEYDRAVEAYKEALRIVQELGNLKNMAASYHQLGAVASRQGDYEGAQAWYSQALELYERIDDPDGLAAIYHQQGLVASARGEYDRALELFRRALDFGERNGNLLNMAAAYHQFGVIAGLREDYEQAVSWYRKALEISRKLGARSGQAASYHQLGLVAQKLGDFDRALEMYRESLKISGELGDRAGESLSLAQIGALLLASGRFTEAIPLIAKSVLIFKDLRSPYFSRALDWLKRQKSALGDDEFLRLLEQAFRGEEVKTVLKAVADSSASSSSVEERNE